MPATTYYLTTPNPQLTVPVAAWAMKRTFWREPKIYRDNFQPLKQGTIANAGGTGQLNSVADVPVIAVPETEFTAGGATTTMKVVSAAPDNMAHVPHRVDWVPVSGYALALTESATIPDPPAPTAADSCTFNAASATDTLTQATGTWWPETGDIVTVGTAGSGVVTTALYTFVRMSATTGKLVLNGSIVDISGTITGVTMSLVTAAALPDAIENVAYYADPVIISTGEPL